MQGLESEYWIIVQRILYHRVSSLVGPRVAYGKHISTVPWSVFWLPSDLTWNKRTANINRYLTSLWLGSQRSVNPLTGDTEEYGKESWKVAIVLLLSLESEWLKKVCVLPAVLYSICRLVSHFFLFPFYVGPLSVHLVYCFCNKVTWWGKTAVTGVRSAFWR